MRVCDQSLHDRAPVQVERAFGEGDVDAVEPILDSVKRLDGDSVDVGGRASEVLEDDDHVEVLEAELHALEVHDLDVGEGDDEEGRLGQLHEAVGRGLDGDGGAGGHTVEAELAERHVDAEVLVLAGVGDLLAEHLELLIELHAAALLLLLGFELFLVAVAVLALAVARLVNLGFRGFTEELDVLSLLLADDDRVDEVDVEDDDQLASTGLEEQVLDVAEEDVDLLATSKVVVAETVLVDFDGATDALAFHRRTHEDVI